ncbi:MAG: hypothetical protein K2X34_12010 [Hyphomonadaceae bacterium]|nr:hypothetical protein [Hyphomonadaceae bacterium]
MWTVQRGTVALIVAAALALCACERQGEAPVESAGGPTNEEREAELAAEQLAALGGPANAAQRALYEGEFQASGGLDPEASAEGSDAAWELRLLDDYIQFSRPGLGEDGGIPGERDYRERGMRVVAGPLTITIMQQACSASGLELGYVAHVLFEGVAYQGCARRGVDEGARPTWASVLPELIPAIDACMGRVTARPARVTFATSIDDGQVSVRVRESNGLRRECIADAGGGGVTLYESISDLDRRPGEGDPEFQRGGAQPRAENCRTVEPAMSRSGDQLGWLIRRSC